MKKNDFNNLSPDELAQKKTAFKEELHKLNYQRKAGRVDKPHLFSK
ncbi:MAG TPA: 50S ribosomal protein L29, partial [Candidatus Omnitrophica bacterium]|nr:50S ribosomal protein L29 [Candidatus Omnitrophota bacterium]